MTVSATARIRCASPGRYAKSLAARFSATSGISTITTVATEWDGEQGRGHLRFSGTPQGEVGMISGDGVLLLQLECSPAEIEQFEEMLGTKILELSEDFEEPDVVVQWKRSGGQDGSYWTSASPPVVE